MQTTPCIAKYTHLPEPVLTPLSSKLTSPESDAGNSVP
ncbi:hypothetical protein CFter6_3265 [Collimonas fungivorans]|uniref:Uncharacterized protein n=1 Tax=Collimonas fungivorans TaxID=158899 RepID=A0A127PDM8_9BURK|nr:hypothetical protein CFter6_3265 [Collimonas fungivorans]